MDWSFLINPGVSHSHGNWVALGGRYASPAVVIGRVRWLPDVWTIRTCIAYNEV